MDDIFLTDLELARKERNDAIARAEAAEGEVARMRVWQGHPDGSLTMAWLSLVAPKKP